MTGSVGEPFLHPTSLSLLTAKPGVGQGSVPDRRGVQTCLMTIGGISADDRREAPV
jgi:hypothetical protein